MTTVAYPKEQLKGIMDLADVEVEDVLLPGEVFHLGTTKNRVLKITPSEVICQRWEKKPPLVNRVIFKVKE